MTEPALSIEQLRDHIATRDIDTVVVGFTDHYGRLMGKRLDAAFFADASEAGTHACDYLLTVDMEMEPVGGYAFSDWAGGYGDVHLAPDMATLRVATWLDRTAMVLCDVKDHDGRLVDVAPRSVLRRQVDNAAAAGFEIKAASELEYFVYRSSYRDAADSGRAALEPAGSYVEDYHLLQAARNEDINGAFRRHLAGSGIPVESTKGEAAVGQHEINVAYTGVLAMADRHVTVKQALKEIADSLGASVTFMAKPDADQPGSSSHLHVSLWRDGNNVFVGESDAFRFFLGGWIRHAAELMVCLAPTVNSYKRYQVQSWAPTSLAWSHDNRTAGFRIVGHDESLRIECRLPGADVNPYLAYAAVIAAGLDGIENRIEPPPELTGDAYRQATDGVPTTLRAAAERFAASDLARGRLGDDVVDHYAHAATVEADAFDRAVTDWEHRRYFERI